MRITKVTTKKGDAGQTILGDGQRVSKTHPHVRCLGLIDELNARIGHARVVAVGEVYDGELREIQNDLLNLGGDVSLPKKTLNLLKSERLTYLEERIGTWNKTLPPLKEFVLPGGNEFSSRLHLARTQCRSVERAIVELLEAGSGNPNWVAYLNRLSDYLFVLARHHVNQTGQDEPQWERD